MSRFIFDNDDISAGFFFFGQGETARYVLECRCIVWELWGENERNNEVRQLSRSKQTSCWPEKWKALAMNFLTFKKQSHHWKKISEVQQFIWGRISRRKKGKDTMHFLNFCPPHESLALPACKMASGKQCCQEDKKLPKEATGNVQRAKLLRNWLPT